MNRATGSLRGTVESGRPWMDSCRAGTRTNSFPSMGTVPRPPSCCRHGPLTEVASRCTRRNLSRDTDDRDDGVVAAFRHHSRLRRAPGSAACCIRKDRRQLPRKVKGHCHPPPKGETAIHASRSPFSLTAFPPLWFAAQQRVGVCGETAVLLPRSMPDVVS